MGIKRIVLYSLFSLLLIVSFQNCGQQGVVALEMQDQSKLANNDLVDISDDVSDVQQPPNISPPKVEPPKAEPPHYDPPVYTLPTDPNEKDDDTDMVDSDEDGNIKGKLASCAGLLKVRIPSIGVQDGGTVHFKNTKGLLISNGKENLSLQNHHGIILLSNIGNISFVSNVHSIFTSIKANSIQDMNNMKALSLIDAKVLGSMRNYRGLSCVAGHVGEIENFHGILEVKGNIKYVRNFRGILKVEGDVGIIDNFRGILQVSGSVGQKLNVKVMVK